MPIEVLVPPLGQTVDVVKLVSWYKSEGDTVQQGEPLFVIETDKATLDIEGSRQRHPPRRDGRAR